MTVLIPVVETAIRGLQIVVDKSTLSIDDKRFFRSADSESARSAARALKACVDFAFLFEREILNSA